MAKAVGIDIGSKSLKILELESSGAHFKITNFFNLEIPLENDDADVEALLEPIKEIFRQNRLEQNNLAISLPTQDCILREILVDFTHDDLIRKIIRYEAEKYLHSYPIEEVIIDYHKLQEIGDKKSKIFLVAVPKEVISQRLLLLNACELDPINIDIDVMALVNLARNSPRIQEQETVVVVDFGAVSTNIIVLCQGELRHVRAIRLGANIREHQAPKTEPKLPELPEDLDEIDIGIEEELIISLPVPEGVELDRMVLVRKEEENKTTSHEKRQEEVFDRLIREIKRTMLTLDTEGSINLICLTGGGSQMPGLLERFESFLKIETTLLEFPEKVHFADDLNDEAIFCSPVALGLAMGVLDKNCKGMNFRREEFSYTHRFDLLKFPIAVFMSLLFILVLTWTYYFQNQRMQIEKHYDELVTKVDAVIKERAFPEESLGSNKFKKILNLLRMLQDEHEIRQSGVKAHPDGFKRWQLLFENFRKVRNRHSIIINEFEITPEQAFISGEADNDRALDQLKKICSQIDEVDPSGDKTRILLNEANEKPKSPELKRRYKIQIGFRNEQEE